VTEEKLKPPVTVADILALCVEAFVEEDEDALELLAEHFKKGFKKRTL